MKSNQIKIISSIFIILFSVPSFAQVQFEISEGIYRIPYNDGTNVKITRHHLSHFTDSEMTNLECRIDMISLDKDGDSIVAAAEGTIMYVVDDNPDDAEACAENNYVWIAHPNGEWTKYSHMTSGSSSSTAGLDVGDYVCAGQFLGFEDSVGCAGGEHLHFEVGVPDDLLDPISASGGYIKGINKIPVICGIPPNVFSDDATYFAQPCDYDGCATFQSNAGNYFDADEYDVDIADEYVTNTGIVEFYNGSNGIYQAGEYILLQENFTAFAGSQFIARIRTCNNPGWDVTCVPVGKEMEINLIDNEESKLNIYPNPFSKNCTIQIQRNKNDNAIYSIALFSTHGIKVFESILELNTSEMLFDATKLPNGVYQCVFMQDELIIEAKSIVKIK